MCGRKCGERHNRTILWNNRASTDTQVLNPSPTLLVETNTLSNILPRAFQVEQRNKHKRKHSNANKITANPSSLYMFDCKNHVYARIIQFCIGSSKAVVFL